MKIRLLQTRKKELVSLIAQHHETLSSSLKNDDLKVFEKYVDCFTEYASLIEAQAFEIGFSLTVCIQTNMQQTVANAMQSLITETENKRKNKLIHFSA